jgi:hypothetical protein
MRKRIALLLFAILAAFYVACGSGYSSPTAPANAPTPMAGAGPTPTPPRY